jgi:hypothetical protein
MTLSPPPLMEGHHWEVSGAEDFPTFFHAVPILARAPTMLALAGGACPRDVRAALQLLDVEPAVPIAEVLPIVFLYSVCIPVSESAMKTLARLAANHAAPEIANDVALFTLEASLLEWFDAPYDPISIAPAFGQPAVVRFAAAIQGSWKEVGSGP